MDDEIVIEKTVPLVNKVETLRYRWFIVITVVLGLALAIAISIIRQPELENLGDADTSLPDPEWWQILIACFLGIAFGAVILVYFNNTLELDLVEST